MHRDKQLCKHTQGCADTYTCVTVLSSTVVSPSATPTHNHSAEPGICRKDSCAASFWGREDVLGAPSQAAATVSLHPWC